MSLYNYVDAPNTNLLCCICRAPFTEPITTTTCQHTFCRECITRALSHSPQCPIDRSQLSSTDLGPVNPIVRSLVDELLVECVYRGEGCQDKPQRQLLAAHLKDKCTFSDAGRLREKLAVQNEKEIGKEEDEKTASTAPRDQIDKPGTSQSTNSPSKVLFEAPKSAAVNDSRASTSTQPTSSPRNAPISTCRVAQLTEQNIILQHRVDSLEGAIQFLRKEMAMVRTVLSPWMQNAASNGSTVSTPSDSNRNSPVQSEGGHITFVDDLTFREEHHNSTTNIDSTQSTREGERDRPRQDASTSDRNDLASYFPAEDEVRVRRTVAQPSIPGPSYNYTQRQRPPGVGHHHHHSVPSVPGINPAEAYSTMSPLGMGYLGHPSTSPYASMGLYGSIMSPPGPQYQPIAVTVSDLDTSSSSISTTIHGLHSSVVSLASSVDEIHKKSDLTLALMGGCGAGAAIPGGGVVGEVLRLGEEVMGVRATVQGLRMQMHNLMMGNVGVAPGGGMNLGFPGRPQPPNTNSAAEEGGTEGYVPQTAQGLQNQRPYYPVVPGITKL